MTKEKSMPVPGNKNKKSAIPEGEGKGFILSVPSFSLVVYASIHEASQDWEKAAPQENVFLQRSYLSVLEDAPPKGMQFAYLLFYKKEIPVGIAICQIKNFKAGDSLNYTGDKKTPCFFETFARFLKGVVVSKVDFNTLVCGNLLLTGPNGFYFDPEELEAVAFFELLEEGLNLVQKLFEEKGTKISMTLIKEVFESSRSDVKPLLGKGYNEFTIQPNMVMELDASWNSMDDYAAALVSKYRIRMKRARKKGGAIRRVLLTEADVQQHLSEIYDLYAHIAQNAGFNVVDLNEYYLAGLKERLGENFQICGYFLEDRLVAFYTLILNDREMEAHFLGLDPALNLRYQLYLNILFDLIEWGIKLRAKRLIFARTALEIKSSVGAKAHEMYSYMRHRNAFTNKFVNPILEYLRPPQSWVPRHPFGIHKG